MRAVSPKQRLKYNMCRSGEVATAGALFRHKFRAAKVSIPSNVQRGTAALLEAIAVEGEKMSGLLDNWAQLADIEKIGVRGPQGLWWG